MKSTAGRRRERKKHLDGILKQCGLDPEAIETIRQALLEAGPTRSLGFWFSARTDPPPWFPLEDVPAGDLLSFRRELRGVLRNRSSFLAWVQGIYPRSAWEGNFLRLPDADKQEFVSLILTYCRRRFPWLTSRLLHTMAFRPEWFDSESPREDGRSSPRDFGPLYRSATVPKGNGVRQLLVPNPVLREVQRAIAKLLGPGVRTLTTPFVRQSIFANAGAHLGAEEIARFDLKNFFPSTSVDQIVAGLRGFEDAGIPMISAHLVRKVFPRKKTIQDVPYSRDGAVLLACLATHRRRLPQGGPSSPALASCALAKADRLIHADLVRAFGPRIRYTRYVDDLTVSMPRGSTSSAKSRATVDFGRRAEEIVRHILARAGYRLNDGKTRLATANQGFRVTGLVCTRDKIRLPRTVRRRLRAVRHSLRHGDFLELARSWYHEVLRPPLDEKLLWREAHAVVRVLRITNPDLVLEIRSPFGFRKRAGKGKEVWFTRRIGFRGVPQQAGPLLAQLIRLVWSGSISPVEKDAGRKTLRFDLPEEMAGEQVLLHAESDLGLVTLPRTDAVAAARYYLHLRGWLSFLLGAPSELAFSPIRAEAQKLGQALSLVQVPASSPRAAPSGLFVPAPPADQMVPFGWPGRILHRVTGIRESVRQLLRLRHSSGCPPSIDWESMSLPASNQEEFVSWLATTCGGFLSCLPRSIASQGLASSLSLPWLLLLEAKRPTPERGRFQSTSRLWRDLPGQAIELFQECQLDVLRRLEDGFEQAALRPLTATAEPDLVFLGPWCGGDMDAHYRAQRDLLLDRLAALEASLSEAIVEPADRDRFSRVTEDLLVVPSQAKQSWDPTAARDLVSRLGLELCKLLYEGALVGSNTLERLGMGRRDTRPPTDLPRDVWWDGLRARYKDVARADGTLPNGILEFVKALRDREAHGWTNLPERERSKVAKAEAGLLYLKRVSDEPLTEMTLPEALWLSCRLLNGLARALDRVREKIKDSQE